MRSTLLAAALGMGVLSGATAASAANVLATYYRATAGGDFETACCDTSVTVGATLGPNGLPVYVSGVPGLTEIDAGTNEIQWWTDDAGAHINQDGSPVLVSLPLNDTSLFPSQGGGSGNGGANGFQTAVFRGFFNTTLALTPLTFNVTSDDDVFLYIDNQFVNLGLDGIHPPQTTVTPYGVAGSGLHTFQLFYADRHTTQAELSFSLIGADLRGTVPEPTTWALMILGFGGVGVTLRSRRRTLAGST